LTSGDHELLSVLVAGFALILLIQSALSLARSWWVMVLSQTVSIQWLSNVFAHLLKLPADWFAQRHLGDIASRFGAVHDIQRTLTQTTLESLLDGLMAIAALVMMFIYSPTLTWVVLAASALYAIVRWISYTPFRHAASERLVLAGQEQSHFIETLRAMTPLKLFARENERRTRWQSLMVEVMNRDFQTAKLNMGFNAARTLIFGLENLCVFWLGAKIILASQAQNSGNSVLTVGMLLAFISYKMQFTGRVSALINQGIELKMLNLHRDRLADIVLTPLSKTRQRATCLSTIWPTCQPALNFAMFRFVTPTPSPGSFRTSTCAFKLASMWPSQVPVVAAKPACSRSCWDLWHPPSALFCMVAYPFNNWVCPMCAAKSAWSCKRMHC